MLLGWLLVVGCVVVNLGVWLGSKGVSSCDGLWVEEEVEFMVAEVTVVMVMVVLVVVVVEVLVVVVVVVVVIVVVVVVVVVLKAPGSQWCQRR